MDSKVQIKSENELMQVQTSKGKTNLCISYGIYHDQQEEKQSNQKDDTESINSFASGSIVNYIQELSQC